MVGQREIEAAQALVKLANAFSNLPKNDWASLRDHDLDDRQHAKLHISFLKANNEEKEHKKMGALYFPRVKNNRNRFIDVEENSHEIFGLLDALSLNSRLNRKRRHHIEACGNDIHDRFGRKFSGREMSKKKQKAKTDMPYLNKLDQCSLAAYRKLIDRPTFTKKKLCSKKANAGIGSLGGGVIHGTAHSGKTSMEGVVPVTKPTKKQLRSLITSTIHSGFSFSIIHLLSAVRAALITHGRDIVDAGNYEKNILPSLTIHEIVQRVKLKPGDPSILETKEPLQELVKGVLKIFSSRTAPLRAKSWKVLANYEKYSKGWSWIGPISFDLSHDDCVNEEISSKAWGIPRRTLEKMIDCFANWLKEGQDSVKQIESLPSPPVLLMQPVCMEERFRHLKALKSLSTISPSCDEIITYFRREEALRYLIPDRAFSYTAVDGRKSTVAPLRSFCDKPSVKARDHFMLKDNRPPHFTVLSLVRDAAARLPGSIGTRADVCTLIRDSQFVMEEIPDLQVNQVVSGALDRLHYELDPCVRFDRDRHLWVYLHREREDLDFEQDGTSSRKRGKKSGERKKEKCIRDVES